MNLAPAAGVLGGRVRPCCTGSKLTSPTSTAGRTKLSSFAWPNILPNPCPTCSAGCWRTPLNYQPGIEFSPGGLNDPDQPAIRVIGAHGSIDLWIDIGNPSAKRMHKASKAAQNVMIYTYKSAAVLLGQNRPEGRAPRRGHLALRARPEVFWISSSRSSRRTRAGVFCTSRGGLDVTVGEESFASELKPFSFV